MPGIEYTDGWTSFLVALFLFVVVVVPIVIVVIGLGAGISWAITRTPPRSRFLRASMGLAAAVVVIALVLWIADGAKLPAHITGTVAGNSELFR